jgi:hypothetical protein
VQLAPLLVLLLLLLLEGRGVVQVLWQIVLLLAPRLALLLLLRLLLLLLLLLLLRLGLLPLLRPLLELLNQVLQPHTTLAGHVRHARPCGDGAPREVLPQLRGQRGPAWHLNLGCGPPQHLQRGRQACEQRVLRWRPHPGDHRICRWAEQGRVTCEAAAPQELAHHLPLLTGCCEEDCDAPLACELDWELVGHQHDATGWGGYATAPRHRDVVSVR